MRDCANAEVRDKLPELVHGRLDGAERLAVEAHVAECPDCAAETALIRLVAGSAAIGLPRMDSVRIVAAIPAAKPPATQRRVWNSGAVRWAAGFVVAVIGIGAVQMYTNSSAVNVASRPLPAAAARAVVRPVGGSTQAGRLASAPTNRTGLVLVGGIDALSLDQLEALVTGVETLSSDLSDEPEALQLSTGEEIR